jgi:hypothetical protein
MCVTVLSWSCAGEVLEYCIVRCDSADVGVFRVAFRKGIHTIEYSRESSDCIVMLPLP